MKSSLIILLMVLALVAVAGAAELPPLPPEPPGKGHTSITQAENSAMRLRAAKARQATNAPVIVPQKSDGFDWQAVQAQAMRDDLFRLTMEQQQRKYWAASPRERATMKPMPPIDRNSPRERAKTKTAIKP